MIRTVHVRDVAGYVRRRAKGSHAAAVRAIRVTMRGQGPRIVREEINATQPHPPFDRGEYLRSWRELDIDDGGRFFSTSSYASVIDRGRRPGTWTPIGPLIGWVKRKGLNRWDNNPGMRGRVKGKANLESNARSIAFAIAAAIKKRGLPPKNVFARAAKRIIAACKQAVNAAWAKAEDRAAG